MGIRPEDLEQEVRLRLWKTFEHEREIADPASFIRRVALTAAIDTVRRIKARREEPLKNDAGEQRDSAGERADPSPAASPEEVARGREIWRKLKTAMNRIPESRQHPVKLHLQGFTSDEIGRLLGFTEAKARNLVYRGMDDLKRELRTEGIEHEAG
jgi:RNA polymerase sigma-70 factor (ECF subfamily)